MGILSRNDLFFCSRRVKVIEKRNVLNTINTRMPIKENSCDKEILSIIEFEKSIGDQQGIPQISTT